MSWDYAQMSKAAKQSGGPEKWIGTIKAARRSQGHRDMFPIVALAMGVGTAIGGIAVMLGGRLAGRQQALEAESAKAEKIVIAHIESEDAARESETEEQGAEKDSQ